MGETGVPNWNDRHAELYRMFVEAQLQANPAFQLPHGYGTDKQGDANLAICAAQIAHRFDCLSTTLEMPYKDAYELPEPTHGWSPARCEKLGDAKQCWMLCTASSRTSGPSFRSAETAG